MGKYFTIDEFRTKFRELLEAKRESDKYSDTEIMQIHQHLFGDNENKELIYLIPEYFLEAAKDIKEEIARECYPKIIKDSKIYDSDKLFSTPPNLEKNRKECIFVLTQNNELLIEEAEKNRGKQDRTNHSSLAGHKPVQMAGTIHVVTGIIKAINNESGHFTPSKENFMQFLKKYVNNQQLTLCSENFNAKYIVNDSNMVCDTELESVSREEIKSYLNDCPREVVQSSFSSRLSVAKRGLFASPPELGGSNSAARRGLFASPPELGGSNSAARRGLFASPQGNDPNGGARSTRQKIANGQTTGAEISHAVRSPGTNFLELLTASERDLPTTPPKTP